MYDSRAVANELIKLAREDGRTFSPMQLIKLVYICHGWMLGLYGRPLAADLPEAWRYGPVFPEIYHALKHYGAGQVTKSITTFATKFDPSSSDLIRQVYEKYGKLSGIELSNLTHQVGTPWDETWRRSRSAPIPNDLVEDYYRRLADERRAAASA